MITCRTLQKGDETRLVDFLKVHAATSMFMLSNFAMRGFEDLGRAFDATYYGVFEKDVLKGVISHAWNGFLGLKVPEIFYQQPLFAYVKEKTPRDFLGITGESQEADHFLKFVGADSRKLAFYAQESLMHLSLERMELPQKFQENHFQIVRSDQIDLDLLIDWRVAYEQESFGALESEEHLKKKAHQTMLDNFETKRYFVLKYQGEPCSHGGLNAYFEDFGQLGGIFTPFHKRSQGFAQILIYLFLKKMAQEQGLKECFLFTANAAAFKAYQNLGFKEIGNYTLVRF